MPISLENVVWVMSEAIGAYVVGRPGVHYQTKHSSLITYFERDI